MTAQVGTSRSSNVEVEKDDNDVGKCKANDNNGGGGKNNKPKQFKGGEWYETYTDLTDMIKIIFLAT